jgi:hypothetical protein
MTRYEFLLIVEHYTILYVVQSHPVDAVEAHHARNRRPVRPPAWNNLANAATRQLNQTALKDRYEDKNENDNNKDYPDNDMIGDEVPNLYDDEV